MGYGVLYDTGVLAYSQTRTSIYIYWGVKTVAAIIGEGTIMTLVLAFVADVVPAANRTQAFGWVMSCLSVGMLVGTVTARLLPEHLIFETATVICTLPVLYVLFLLPETLPTFVTVPKRDTSTMMCDDEGQVEGSSHGPIMLRRSTLKDSLALIRKRWAGWE